MQNLIVVCFLVTIGTVHGLDGKVDQLFDSLLKNAHPRARGAVKEKDVQAKVPRSNMKSDYPVFVRQKLQADLLSHNYEEVKKDFEIIQNEKQLKMPLSKDDKKAILRDVVDNNFIAEHRQNKHNDMAGETFREKFKQDLLAGEKKSIMNDFERVREAVSKDYLTRDDKKDILREVVDHKFVADYNRINHHDVTVREKLKKDLLAGDKEVIRNDFENIRQAVSKDVLTPKDKRTILEEVVDDGFMKKYIQQKKEDSFTKKKEDDDFDKLMKQTKKTAYDVPDGLKKKLQQDILAGDRKATWEDFEVIKSIKSKKELPRDEKINILKRVIDSEIEIKYTELKNKDALITAKNDEIKNDMKKMHDIKVKMFNDLMSNDYEDLNSDLDTANQIKRKLAKEQEVSPVLLNLGK